MRRATLRYSEQSAPPYISIHALLAESDFPILCARRLRFRFLSTLSLRRATLFNARRFLPLLHFYPRSPCGERLYFYAVNSAFPYFYPRSPCGERQLPLSAPFRARCISIHALLAESDGHPSAMLFNGRISIHALLAESDGGFGAGNWRLVIFLSTLSLRRATTPIKAYNIIKGFLSTLSLRRATLLFGCHEAEPRYFYPRSPCGERRELV